MRCTQCSGRGYYREHYRGHGCAPDSSAMVWCSLCDGTGTIVHVRTETRDKGCWKCNDTGRVQEPIVTRYPTGREIIKGYRDAPCPNCGGSGSLGTYKVNIVKPKY